MTDKERINQLEIKIKSLHEGYRKELLNLEKFKAMVMNLDQGIMVVDNDDVITKVYESFEKLTGYSEEELIGKKAKDVFLNEGDIVAKLQFQEQMELRRNGEATAYELPILTKSGDEIWVSISGTPLFDSNGIKIGSIGIHYDISRQKRLQRALQAAREESDRAKHAEERFLAKMSHEIRTPLNAVIGMSYLLKGTRLTEEQQEYVDVISRSGNLLLNLINDILDYSKINSGQIQIRPVVCDLKELLTNMAQTFKLKSLNKSISIQTELDIEHPWIKADETLLNQILMNLIGNSEKFTEEGSIIIKAEPLAEFDKTVTYQFSIIDSGKGIAQDRLEAIFQEFVQEEGIVIHDSKGGTGLGLAITKKVIEMMGGKIWAESTVGVGTEMHFVLTFPIAQAETPIAKSTEKESPVRTNELKEHLSVLVAEDNSMNQRYISRILEKIKVNFDLANDGRIAVKLSSEKKYDVIFMDLFMPNLDGFEATEKIRSESSSKNNATPIFALSATAVQQHKEKALKMGMNGFISKPFHPKEIDSVLREISNPLLKNNEPKNLDDLNYTYSEVFDSSTLNLYYGDDVEYALEMFHIFSEQLEEILPLIENALGGKNRSDLRHHVHKLKPTFTMVGFPALTTFYEQWEREIDRADLDFDVFQGRWDEIEEQVRQTLLVVHQEAKNMKNFLNN